ncbi:MAG: DUF5129 domain-containing protein [Corynebacterium sp.]|nr:DUF5129 domain-containing protein [Corynebacterium sp.]
MKKESSRILRYVAATVGIGLLVGGASGAIGVLAKPVPSLEEALHADPGLLQPVTSYEVTLDDPQDVLTSEMEDRVRRDAQRLTVPSVVTGIHYMVFAHNDDNVNDTVENFIRDNRPELISPDDDHFADGALIVGVGLNPRQSFVFAGEDVADALLLRASDSHLQQSFEAIQPGVKANNIPGGLFAGADMATDVEGLRQIAVNDARDARRSAGSLGGFFGFGGGLAVSGFYFYLRNARRERVERARADAAVVAQTYSERALALDGLDVRAHSLSNAFLDAQLRQQWETVRKEFLDLNRAVDSFSALTSASTDDDYLEHADDIIAAKDMTEKMSQAAANIDTIFKVENGDVVERTNLAEALRKDLIAAQLDFDGHPGAAGDNPEVVRRLQLLEEQVKELIGAPDAEDFSQRYLTILSDYQAVLTTIAEREFSDVEVHNELEQPTIYDRHYRPGYSVNNFVPYWWMANWHTSNVEAAASASSSSSSVNLSFSSGFSGAGGSGRF